MKLLLLCLMGFATLVVAPFPPEDPRAVFNAFVIPWWDRSPIGFRRFLHLHLTGEPLGQAEEEAHRLKQLRKQRGKKHFRARARNFDAHAQYERAPVRFVRPRVPVPYRRRPETSGFRRFLGL